MTKAWNIHLIAGNPTNARWLVLAGDDLSYDALMDEIADTNCVSGLFYRVHKIYSDADGNNHGKLIEDRLRVIPIHQVTMIEPVEYIPEIFA